MTIDLIGRYRIERRIGQGAMADVYRAHDPSIGRSLAIKVLKSEFRQNHEITQRFIREAKAAGALSHPNIVTIYDVGQVDGYPYIAMELLEGAPLDEHISQAGPLPLEQVLKTGRQIALALHYAHSLGVVHRDIKPSNIMICDGGQTAKILDFGIARIGEADQIRAEANVLRTQVGQVLGTPRYMSPEQALGLEIDCRTDLFSLGVILYEMITGRAAFNGTSIVTIALQITQQDPQPVRELVSDCPHGLQFIVDKLLSKQPDKRFMSGEAVAEALKREHEALSSGKNTNRSRVSLPVRLTLMVGAVLALALAVSIGAVLDRQYQMMQRMALTSGTSIASFVANNVALRAVENIGLPEAEQDWLPLQAFITAASADPNVQRITMIDAHGIVRGASDAELVGKPYRAAAHEQLLSTTSSQRVTSTSGHDLRFVRTIEYANRPFGRIDLIVDSAELKEAAKKSRHLLIGLGVTIFFLVVGLSFATAQLIARPLRRLKAALWDAADGRLDFRISHNRADEFGELFDGFNRLVDALDEREHSSGAAPAKDAALEATRIDLTPVASLTGNAARRRA